MKVGPSVLERTLIPSVLVAVAGSSVLLPYLIRPDLPANLSVIYLQKQDVWLMLAGIIVILASFWRLRPLTTFPYVGTSSLLTFSAALAIIAWWGRYAVLLDHNLSRDEQMAEFDAIIFSHGQLAAPLPAPWAEHAEALNTMFMLPAADRTAWVSGYLPVNAAIRALFETVGGADALGPLAILIGAAALWGCVRRIWPDDRPSAVLALLFYFTSGQVLVTSMTTYAMPQHLATNLVWLWLFLHRNIKTDAIAICVAFVSVGLHQPIFHPMFAAPLLALLVFEQQWRRALLYFTGYLLIGVFWFYWPNLSVSVTGTSLSNGEAGYVSRLLQQLLHGQEGTFVSIVLNIVRFVSWQHALILPLLLIGLRNLGTNQLMKGLAVGIGLTFFIMVLIVPFQGHGFGYRYLHGLIGSAIILAVLGWRTVRDAFPQWNTLILRTTGGTLLVLLPLQLAFAYASYAPYALASRTIDEIQMDYILIEHKGAPYAVDLAINDPYLRNRPIRLVDAFVTADLAERICDNDATVTLLPTSHYAAIRTYFGLSGPTPAEPTIQVLKAMMQKKGCKFP